MEWNGLSIPDITERVTTKIQAGSIALFHSTALHTPTALPGIIEALLQDGYTLALISQIILPQPYTIDHTGRKLPGRGGEHPGSLFKAHQSLYLV